MSLYRQYRGASHSSCNLKFNLPNEFPVVFHNSSNYGYHFVIKELANEIEDNLNALGKQSTRKVQGFFLFNKKENYKNRLSFLMKVLKIYATK